MDPGVFSIGAILVGIFLATVVFIWQTNSQSNRLESKIDDLGRELRAEIETQGRELRAEMESQGRELRAEMESQGRELRAEIESQGERIEAQGKRVSDSELEQARLNGVNSVLANQTHTHQGIAD